MFLFMKIKTSHLKCARQHILGIASSGLEILDESRKGAQQTERGDY